MKATKVVEMIAGALNLPVEAITATFKTARPDQIKRVEHFGMAVALYVTLVAGEGNEQNADAPLQGLMEHTAFAGMISGGFPEVNLSELDEGIGAASPDKAQATGQGVMATEQQDEGALYLHL